MYYLVWVRSHRYHGSEPLTYSYDKKLATGTLVEVELQSQKVLGVVSGPTPQPRFRTKPIATVYDLPLLPAHLLKLAAWIQEYYPAPLGILTQQLLPASFTDKAIETSSGARSPEPGSDFGTRTSRLNSLPPLTSEQKKALAAMADTDTYLLHGVTGSGKTRLYIELAAQALPKGRSAIILTPEISLTAQLANSFRAVFGEKVIVSHSRQTPAERRASWLAALQASEPVIIIGPRSALFSPVAKLGLIVLDEAHEAAYKQEQAPQYQTGRVASKLAQLAHATLVLGSATPSVSDYYLAEEKKKPIITLTQLAMQINHHNDVILSETKNPRRPRRSFAAVQDDRHNTEIVVVDRKEHNLFNRSSWLSSPLLKAIEGALARGEQSLLYLNRRGTARLVMCENCGWQATCPHCDLPLTYHGDHHELRCHSCDHHQAVPGRCPNCGHADIIFKTAGTKAIVDEVKKIFPQARVARFDTDNLKAERFEQLYDEVKNGDFDILVGTQLIAKGLDLPRLSTLGILLADTSLYLPDFSAQERTFQLISQVMGRIGRGHVAGQAIIQTYHPDHPILKAALENDYQAFYKSELAERKQFLFPPYCYLLKLTVRRASIVSAETAAENLKHDIQTSGYKVRVEGPAPSFYEKLQNKFQWQLVVKARDRNDLLKIIANLPANWSYDLDPLDLL